MKYKLIHLEDSFCGIQSEHGIVKVGRDQEVVETILQRIIDLKAEPCHIRDIIHDFLFETYVIV